MNWCEEEEILTFVFTAFDEFRKGFDKAQNLKNIGIHLQWIESPNS